ncbi:MAG: hypothetical protein ACYTET_03825 [Planctomycetota bacterium]|jgi:Tfp pilus assembly protein PilO
MEAKKKIKLKPYQIALIVTWGCSVILLAIGYFGFYGPQKIELDNVQRDLTESNDILMIGKKAAKPGILQTLQTERDQAKQKIEDFSVDDEDVTGLVFEIGQIANQLQLTDYSSEIREKVSMSTVEKSKTLVEGWLNVKFIGSFEQFAKFVNQVERNHPIVFVEKVALSRGFDGPNENEVAIELSFLTTQPQNQKSVAAVK